VIDGNVMNMLVVKDSWVSELKPGSCMSVCFWKVTVWYNCRMKGRDRVGSKKVFK